MSLIHILVSQCFPSLSILIASLPVGPHEPWPPSWQDAHSNEISRVLLYLWLIFWAAFLPSSSELLLCWTSSPVSSPLVLSHLLHLRFWFSSTEGSILAGSEFPVSLPSVLAFHFCAKRCSWIHCHLLTVFPLSVPFISWQNKLIMFAFILTQRVFLSFLLRS